MADDMNVLFIRGNGNVCIWFYFFSTRQSTIILVQDLSIIVIDSIHYLLVNF